MAANIATAFEIISFTTSALTIRITEYGQRSGNVGSGSDQYNVTLIYPDARDARTFVAPESFFSSATPPETGSIIKEISFSTGWDGGQPVVVVVGELMSVSVENQTKSLIVAGSVDDFPVTSGGGGGIPCFVANSNLLTPTGYVAAKDIKTGDLLMTADGRQVPVKTYSFTVEKADKESAPFLISKNSISLGCPKTDLRLSPWHAFQMKKGLWMKPMSAFELGMPVQQYDLGKSVTYYHFEAPNFFKDNFICEGTVVESFGVFQIKDMKGRPYTYNANLKGYTRAASKSVNKAIMM
jgi:hypothetical protein